MAIKKKNGGVEKEGGKEKGREQSDEAISADDQKNEKSRKNSATQ